MRNTRIAAVCWIVLGALLVASGLRRTPVRWPLVAGGAVAALFGAVRLTVARPGEPPTA